MQDYEKEAFTVLCRAKTFKYEDAVTQIPSSGRSTSAQAAARWCAVCTASTWTSMGGNEFEYLIADNYNPAKEIPDGFTTRTIPAHTWAVFPLYWPDAPGTSRG